MFNIELSEKIIFLHALGATILGACFGSFAALIIHRLPRGLSIIKPRSHCALCMRPLKIWQNLPIISWLILRGRCHFCRAPIGLRPLFIEIIMAFFFLSLYLKFGASVAFLERALFLFLLICLAYIDLDTFYLPTSLLASLIAVGLLSNLIYFFKPTLFVPSSSSVGFLAFMVFNAPHHFSLFDRLSGALLGFLFLVVFNLVATFIFRKLGRLEKNQWAMGFGDAVLLSAIGLFTGLSHMLLLLFLSSLIGSIIGIISRLDKKKITHDEEIAEGALPYGPFLAIAAIYVYLF